MLGRSWTWVIGELLVVGAALALTIWWVTGWDDPSEKTGMLIVLVAVTSGPLLGLAVLAVEHPRAAGWILLGIGTPLLLAAFGQEDAFGDGEQIFFAAPPLGGALLIASGRSGRGAHAPRPSS